MVFITGLGGKFPNSDSLANFWENLCNGVDLVTENSSRYPKDYFNLPNRQAQIQTLSKFDAMFFGVSSAQASCLDPQIRLLLEAVYEAIVDAGYTMADLARTNTGVYIGGCFSDMHKALLSDMRNITGYENTGCSHSMFANRVSFYFDFLGPSFNVDTACSSSLVAFDQAVRDVRSGKVSRAIVGGISIATDPSVTKSFHAYNMLSPNGACHSFDDRANGYVRADAIGVVLLESESIVNNGVMRVLGTGTNSDGWKKNGITFPDSGQQIALFKDVSKEYQIDTSAVTYVEAHGTGTVAGDGQELKAIDAMFGGSALIGSVKSNMGHSEGASGLMSLIKVLGVLNDQVIPTNLHFISADHHEPIASKRLTVVDSTRPFTGGLVAINNFGFGGSNAHLVGGSGERKVVNVDTRTRFIYGRTKRTLEVYHEKNDLNSAAWMKIMRASSMTNKFPWRGVIETDGSLITQEISSSDRPKIAFCYSGQGCQWNHMAKDLWKTNKTFKTVVTDSVIGLPVDLELLFGSGDHWMEQKWSGLGITLVQLGLTAMLKEAGIQPDYIFGHSVGEVACGYADDCTSAQEAARIAYVRCQLSDKIDSAGLMIAIGLGYEDALVEIANYPNTVIACYNSPDGVTLSGTKLEIEAIQSSLMGREIFAKIVPTDNVAYHSVFFKQNIEKIRTILSDVITEPPVKRTERWLSTSDPHSSEYPDAIYHTANIAGMVNFAPVVASLPEGTFVIEIGPHALLKSIIKRCNDKVDIFKAMTKGQPGAQSMENLIDSLWLNGVVFDFPKVQYSVPFCKRVRLQWDHEKDWRFPTFEDFDNSGSTTMVTYDLIGKDSYLMDHVIDGRSLFPATGHIFSAWQAYGTKEIHFVDVKIHSAIILDGVSVTFNVSMDDHGWKIFYDNKLVSSGSLSSSPLKTPGIAHPVSSSIPEDQYLSKDAIYSTFARHGYEYQPKFRLIDSRSLDGRVVRFGETEHWIVYLDNILQAFLKDPKGLNLPTAIEAVSVRCQSVLDAGREITCWPNLSTVGNNLVTLRGLKTTISRKVHKKVVPRGVEFIEYREHLITNNETYKQDLLQILQYQNSINSSVGPLKTILSSNSVLSQSENFDEALVIDPLTSNSPFDAGLDIISQILRENIGRDFSVLELLESRELENSSQSSTVPSEELSRKFHSNVVSDVHNYSSTNVTSAGSKLGHWDLSGSINQINYDFNTPWTGLKLDVIFSAYSLHLSHDVDVTLHSLFDGLRDDGFIVLQEFLGAWPGLVWGKNSQWRSKEEWLTLLHRNGFQPIIWYVDESQTQLLLLAKKLSPPTEGKNLLRLSDRSGLVTDTPILIETQDFGYLGMVRSIRKEPGYSGVRLLLRLGEMKSTLSEIDLPIAVYRDGVLGGFKEVSLREVKNKVGSSGFHVEVPFPGDLSSLQWVENVETPNCSVSFCGINFKDVMLAYGKLTSSGSVKIGLEFSGVDQNGVNVMGISAGCMATRLRAKEHLVWPIPSHMTLEQACTVPVVYSTVYYALVCKANIQPGQTVLIHSIAGGVGQAAFHVCSFRKVKVIVTCSAEKVEWVHSTLGIDRTHILDSRSVDFREGVLELTNGRGVDVVLNSLSGDKLLAGLACVAPYGHFCEIGKYDIQQNMPIGLGIFERNVSIHGFDLGDMFDRPSHWQAIRNLVTEGLQSGEIIPLCTTVFDEIEPALRCISAGKHIGKVLVRLPEASPEKTVDELVTRSLSRKRMFSTRGTHVVIGGLGGFGLEMVAFLWANGAERIVVVSRGAPKAHHLSALGAATVQNVDLINPNVCDEFIASLGSSLVGIWHLGMVLNDRLYANMTDEAWDQTVNVKALISKNLDESSRKHSSSLQYFVLWSSVSALFGNPGQSNYAYANSVMESVCLSRRALGLPGIAIQWGFIGNVGVMMHTVANNTLAFCPQHIDNCLDTMHSILQADQGVVSSYIRRVPEVAGNQNGKKQSLSDRIARVLGIDANKVKGSETLSTLGMDSLQSVEIINILKTIGVEKKVDELRSTSWSDIIAMNQ